MPEQGPGDNWATTTVVEASVPFTGTTDLDIGDGIRDAATRQRMQRRDRTVAVVNWRLRDVTLSPALALVFKAGQPVEATRYCIYGDEAERAGRALAAAPRRRLVGRRCFLGFNRVHGNHYHIVAQLVHAVAGYAAEPGFAEGLLLLPEGDRRVLQALSLAGLALPQIEWLDLAAAVDIKDLTFGSLLTGCDGPSPFCRSVFDRIVQRRPPSSGGPPLIYVWRLDSAARPMRNEDALVAMLAGYGVVPMVMSEFSLDEQVDLFRAARLVVGPHGAGLANVGFCRPGAVLYELLPDHYVNPCMNQLAQTRGLHYLCDVHRAEPEPGVWRHNVPWSVDIGAVERRLVHILSRYALTPAPLTARNNSQLASL